MWRAAILAVPLGIAACDGTRDPVVIQNPANLPVVATLTANISGVGTNASVNGTLELTDRGSLQEATITLRNVPADSVQWQIYRGNCAAHGGLAGNSTELTTRRHSTLQVYGNLVRNSSGTATAAVTIMTPLYRDSAHFVRIGTFSPANRGTEIACGNLTRS